MNLSGTAETVMRYYDVGCVTLQSKANIAPSDSETAWTNVDAH